MGQYYDVILEQNGKTFYFNMQIKGSNEHNPSKLMEHSWWENPFCLALSSKIHNKPSRIIWCGDYWEEEDFDEFEDKEKIIQKAKKLNENGVAKEIEESDFSLDGKYLVNHDMKVYVDLCEYHKQNERDGWCIFPISLLTAVGNGRGGGDYEGVNKEDVGIWSWNLLSIDDKAPENFEKVELEFYED